MKKLGRGKWNFTELVFSRFQIKHSNGNGSGQECPLYTFRTVRLGYLTPNKYAERSAEARDGKDGGEAALENAEERVSHFPTAPATAGDLLETSQDQNVV